MSGLSRDVALAATTRDGAFAVERIQDGKIAGDDTNWFSEATKVLLPVKAGTILHLTTGLGDERLCQRYAAGTVKPPAYFFRALLRGPTGFQWLSAAMDGSNAQWWRELDAARELTIKYRVERR